ncbi:MAG: acetyl-CoA C-acyltransferase, partial [Pseudomonadota bacterium]|nr:acetyl-CoA C-acyltransferase [Pseudomonadota bacterium]
FAVRGVPPEIMGIGPKFAIPAALAAAGIPQDQLDWIELNEAFAAQSLAVINSLGLDPTKVNRMGGAIALGHPLGASGTKLMATLIHALRARGKRFGLQTMCEGGGIANVTIVEAL